MPYVSNESKGRLSDYNCGRAVLSSGELNYLFTMSAISALNTYASGAALYSELMRIAREYCGTGKFNSDRINTCAGALILANLEFMRRTQATKYEHFFHVAIVDIYAELGVPYERLKIEENGDVYPAHLVRG